MMNAHGRAGEQGRAHVAVRGRGLRGRRAVHVRFQRQAPDPADGGRRPAGDLGRGQGRGHRRRRRRGRRRDHRPEGPADRTRRPARPGTAARLPGRARPPGLRRRDHDRLQPDRGGDSGRGGGPDRGLRGGAPREGVDLGQRLADGVVRARDAEPAPAGQAHRRQAVVPDQPGRARGWANTRALELAGFGAGTPDPPDGRFEREDDGTLQGAVHEGAADLVGAFVPKPTFEERLAGLLLAQRHLHERGVTAWQDAIVGPYLGSQDPLPVYLAAAGSGQLTARVQGALWWERGRGAEQIDELRERRETGQAGRFRANTVKIMQDGVAENFTAGMLEPYLDACGCQTTSRGLSHVDPEELRAHVSALDALGFQVHCHAIGDRAVRECLDALAAARAANGSNDHRHHIAHLQVVHPDDMPRFARLGVTANMQALWAAHEPQIDELTIPFLGPGRSARQYLFGDLLRSGARLAAGSDWAVSSASPLRAIHVAVNRSLHESSGAQAEPLLPGQALDLAEAMAACTIGSAYVNHLDDVTGSIEPGKLGDLIVLDRDPFARPAAEIAEATVLATYVQGAAVYRSPSLA